MLKSLVNDCKVKLKITNTGPLLVKSGYATPFGSDMTPVVTYRGGQDPEVFIPGSSLKGVFRSHLEKVCRTINPKSACNPFEKIPEQRALAREIYSQVSCGQKFTKIKSLLGNNQDLDGSFFTKEFIYHNSCLACRLFGSTSFVGRLAFNDAYLDNPVSTSTLVEKRDGVGIDRFSGGSSDGAKFELEVVRSGTVFETELYLRNFENWQLGALLLLVKDLEDRLIRVGSGRSRGLGEVQGQVEEMWIGYLRPRGDQVPGDQVWGLGKFLDNGSYGTDPGDVIELDGEIPARDRGIRRQLTLKGPGGPEEGLFARLTQKSLENFTAAVQAFKPGEGSRYDYLVNLGGQQP